MKHTLYMIMVDTYDISTSLMWTCCRPSRIETMPGSETGIPYVLFGLSFQNVRLAGVDWLCVTVRHEPTIQWEVYKMTGFVRIVERMYECYIGFLQQICC